MGLFSGLFGGDDGNSDKWAKKSYKLAKDQLKRARPIQDLVYEQLRGTMSGGFSPDNSPLFQAGKLNIERNYQNAMDNLFTMMPAGGVMYSTMGDLEAQRARNLSDLMANLQMDEWNKAYGVATGAPQQSLAQMANLGMGGMAADATRSAGQNQAVAGGASALGSIIAAMVF